MVLLRGWFAAGVADVVRDDYRGGDCGKGGEGIYKANLFGEWDRTQFYE